MPNGKAGTAVPCHFLQKFLKTFWSFLLLGKLSEKIQYYFVTLPAICDSLSTNHG